MMLAPGLVDGGCMTSRCPGEALRNAQHRQSLSRLLGSAQLIQDGRRFSTDLQRPDAPVFHGLKPLMRRVAIGIRLASCRHISEPLMVCQ